jgi:hypothetical protein
LRKNRAEDFLAFEQRQLAQVISVQLQKVKGIIDRVAFASHQMIKGRHSGFVQCHYFTIQDRAFDLEYFSDCRAKLLEPLHFISLARYESTSALVDIGEGAKAVVFDLVNPIRTIENIRTVHRNYWVELGEIRNHAIFYIRPAGVEFYSALPPALASNFFRCQGPLGSQRTGSRLKDSSRFVWLCGFRREEVTAGARPFCIGHR